MTTIYLVRHGATEWNLTRRAQGQADIALTDEGRRQALDAAAALRHVDLDAVYSSDLARSVETARPIAAAHGLQVETDAAFREIDQGEWTGLEIGEIERRWPDLWGPARHYSARPGGESPGQVRERALAGVRRIVRRHPGGRVAIVSHGGTIRWLSAEALGYDDHASARIRGLSNGEVVRLEARLEGERLVLGGLMRSDGATTDVDDPNV